MPEEKIFGQFTLNQFIRLAAGIGAGYAAYTYLPLSQAKPVIVVIALLTLAAAFYNNKSANSFDINSLDEIFQKMKLEKGSEFTHRYIQKKIAEVASQVEERKQKGLREDPLLNEALVKLQGVAGRFH